LQATDLIPTASPTQTPAVVVATPTSLPPTQTPVPSPTPTTIHLPSSDQVFVQAGTFTCGSTRADIQAVVGQICATYADRWCREGVFEDELTASEVSAPQAGVFYLDRHSVDVGGFYIEHYEVTNAQYGLCVGAGVCAAPASGGSNPRHAYFADSRYGSYPVVYVTWLDAQTYCAWIGARLPTAAEWEKAARGTDGRWWPWGNQPPTVEANFRRPGEGAAAEEDTTLVGGDLAPVGSFPSDSSPYGVMDMAGNVMEWVDAWYGPAMREIRGGSWNTGSFTLRAPNRVAGDPSQSYFDVGFRCARDAVP
jgi:formylglycine-generating enzyme required for sulfatase activity